MNTRSVIALTLFRFSSEHASVGAKTIEVWAIQCFLSQVNDLIGMERSVSTMKRPSLQESERIQSNGGWIGTEDAICGHSLVNAYGKHNTTVYIRYSCAESQFRVPVFTVKISPSP
jgi:hypothetical protein